MKFEWWIKNVEFLFHFIYFFIKFSLVVHLDFLKDKIKKNRICLYKHDFMNLTKDIVIVTSMVLEVKTHWRYYL